MLLGSGVFFLAPAMWAFRRARRQLASSGRVSVITFMLAMFGYLALAIGTLLASWLHAWSLPLDSFFNQIVGVILLLLGGGLYLVARLQFRSFRMTWGLENERLITSGIYRLVRHPQSVGWGIFLGGAALLGRSGVALVLVGMYILSCVIWLPVEEAALEHSFGAAYKRYRQFTRAFIPSTGRRH